jgi:uncharacterized protein YgbK (DUF1537 family)
LFGNILKDPKTTLLIVADDLTGAGDAGVEFCGIQNAIVTDMNSLTSVHLGQHAVISLNTATRNASTGTIKSCMDQLAPWVQDNHPNIIFKKIDSCMRGNPGFEIKTLMAITKKKAIVVSALPNYGRTIQDGLIRLNGQVISESEMGRDIRSPMDESCPEVILQRQSGKTVGHVNLADIHKGRLFLTGHLTELFSRDMDIICLDAVTNEDLDIIAHSALDMHESILFCGSSGLAGAMARTRGDFSLHPVAPARSDESKTLYICGSASDAMKKQMNRFKAEINVCEQVYGNGAPCFDPQMNAHLFRLPAMNEKKLDAEQAGRKLCRAALEIIRENRYRFIFVSGGDTAQAFLESANAGSFSIYGSLLPGIPWGYLHDGPFKGLGLITKSGSFGAEDTLIKINTMLEEGDRSEP